MSDYVTAGFSRGHKSAFFYKTFNLLHCNLCLHRRQLARRGKMDSDGEDAGAPSVPRFNSIFNWTDNDESDLFSQPQADQLESDSVLVRTDEGSIIADSMIPSSTSDHVVSVHSDVDVSVTPSVPSVRADLQSTSDLAGPADAIVPPPPESVPSFLASLEATPDLAGPVDENATQLQMNPQSDHVRMFALGPVDQSLQSAHFTQANLVTTPGPADAYSAPSFPSQHVQLFAPGPVDESARSDPSIHATLELTPDHVQVFSPGPTNLKPLAEFNAVGASTSTPHSVQLFAPGPAMPISDSNATGSLQRNLMKPSVHVDDVAVHFYQPSAPPVSASNGLTLTPNVLYMFPAVLPNDAVEHHSNAPPPYDHGHNDDDEIEPGQAPTKCVFALFNFCNLYFSLTLYLLISRGSEMPARWTTMLTRSRSRLNQNADPFVDLQPTEVKISKRRLGAYAGFCKCIKANPCLSSFGVFAVIASIIGIVYLSHGNSSNSPLSAPLPALCNYGFFRTTNNQTHGACAPMRCSTGFQPPFGVYNSTAWSADCVPCLPSTFNANSSSNVACQTCAPGKFANESAMVACYSCPSRFE
jgi:hypothetical protein